MSSLVEFLRARLNEDAEIAASALPGPWRHVEPIVDWMPDSVDSPGRCVAEMSGTSDAIHIARHNPARVLAEVKAKRAIVDMCAFAVAVPDGAPPFSHIDHRPALRVLRLLASVYADHPDYRPEWKP